MSHRILIIEQCRSSITASLQSLLPAYSCQLAPWDTFNPEQLQRSSAHLIVPVAAPERDAAMGLLRWLSSHRIATPALVVLPSDPGEEILQAAVEVAEDFVLWPVRPDEFRHRVARILGSKSGDLEEVRAELREALALAQLVGSDPTFVRAVEKIVFFARADAPVLIAGETGTGKELCARAIHHLSKRRSFSFIAVECGALPDHLFENELFGHVRGAFTDARTDQKGLVALAEGGTLFLDEVDALSLTAQTKLLRFLQEHVYRPLGAERFLRADVTIIAATNRDFETCVRDKQFRADLYFRLNVLRLDLPPLRGRYGDIAPLSRHFLQGLCAKGHLKPKTFSPTALRKLEHYDWPGNVRELFNVVQRALVCSPGERILPSDIQLGAASDACDAPPVNFRQARAHAIQGFERRYLEELLPRHGGNITRAAIESGKDRRALGRLIKKYGIFPRAQ